MADERQAGIQGFASSDFIKVLLKLEEKTMKDLHVASVGKVVDANEPYICQLIPTFNNEKEKNVQCYCLEGITPEVDDWVLILFTDRNFIRNLKQARNNQSISQIESQSELHSQSYGIIIGKIKHSTSE